MPALDAEGPEDCGILHSVGRAGVHIIVGGCGRLGSEIAEHLSQEPDNDVVVVDIDPLAFDRLGSAFNGETVVGDTTDRDVLERAGVAHAHGLVAVTRFDNANLMSVEIAKHLYGVERTVARLFNPERETSYQKLGIRYVSGTGVIAKLILNEFRSDTFRHHVHFPHGEVAVVEMVIGPGGHGMLVETFELDGKVRIAAIVRGARVFIPGDGDRLEHGDLVVAAVRRGAYRRLSHLLQAGEVHPTERAVARNEAR
jgi:trk system potassium uptake protein TrkA